MATSLPQRQKREMPPVVVRLVSVESPEDQQQQPLPLPTMPPNLAWHQTALELQDHLLAVASRPQREQTTDPSVKTHPPMPHSEFHQVYPNSHKPQYHHHLAYLHETTRVIACISCWTIPFPMPRVIERAIAWARPFPAWSIPPLLLDSP